MRKNKFYDINNILKEKCTYNIIIGKRSNGKSYAVKYLLLKTAYTEKDPITGGKIDRYEMGYIRRWRDEIKNSDVKKYFEDMPISEITNNEYTGIDVYNGDIFFCNYDDNGKMKRGKHIGNSFALTSATHYKSLAYPKIGYCVFEEFITDSVYLPHEENNLMSIISTIARNDEISVFMVGNTIDRTCPYFNTWSLSNVKKQKQDTIEIYNQHTGEIDENNKEIIIKIAVENCGNDKGNTKNLMFFGNSRKSIVSGQWESETQKTLDGNFDKDYRKIYKMIIENDDFSYMVHLLQDKQKNVFLYVYPCTKLTYDDKLKIRIVTNNSNLLLYNKLSSLNLTILTKYDNIIINLIRNKKIAFSDNLTGSEFYKLIKNI